MSVWKKIEISVGEKGREIEGHFYYELKLKYPAGSHSLYRRYSQIRQFYESLSRRSNKLWQVNSTSNWCCQLCEDVSRAILLDYKFPSRLKKLNQNPHQLNQKRTDSFYLLFHTILMKTLQKNSSNVFNLCERECPTGVIALLRLLLQVGKRSDFYLLQPPSAISSQTTISERRQAQREVMNIQNGLYTDRIYIQHEEHEEMSFLEISKPIK